MGSVSTLDDVLRALPTARVRFGMGQSPADMRTWMEMPLEGTQDLLVLALHRPRGRAVPAIHQNTLRSAARTR